MVPSNYATTVDDYLLDCRRRGLRPATIRYYDQVLDRIPLPPAPISPSRASARSRRSASARDPSAIAGRLTLRWLVDEDVLTADPLARLRLPRVDQGVVTAPTDREMLALLWASGPLLRTVLAVLLGTGGLDACAVAPNLWSSPGNRQAKI